MNSIFLPEADEEFREAVRFYESEAPGIGIRFIAEVRRTLGFITDRPLASPVVFRDIRRSALNHFPYSLMYAIESDSVVVVAIAHQRRRPSY